jgi:hypothetical protein
MTSPRRRLVICHETPSVVSTEAIGGLRQVIGAEAEKLRVLGQFGLNKAGSISDIHMEQWNMR